MWGKLMKIKQIVCGGLMALSALLFTSISSAKAVTSAEYQQVVDTAYNYFNGVTNGDQALLQKAFDMEFGHIKSITIDKDTGKETIRSMPLKEFAAIFKKATPQTWTADVLSVDIVDRQMAMVKLQFDTPKSQYIDYLVMYKRNDQWRIINKTFTVRNK